MSGYWGDDDETRDTLRDGWLRTRDLGYVDGDGFIYLVGPHPRRDHGQRHGGLRRAPSSRRWRAIPTWPRPTSPARRTSETGEAVHAFVVPAAGRTPDTDALRALVRDVARRRQRPPHDHDGARRPRGRQRQARQAGPAGPARHLRPGLTRSRGRPSGRRRPRSGVRTAGGGGRAAPCTCPARAARRCGRRPPTGHARQTWPSSARRRVRDRPRPAARGHEQARPPVGQRPGVRRRGARACTGRSVSRTSDPQGERRQPRRRAGTVARPCRRGCGARRASPAHPAGRVEAVRLVEAGAVVRGVVEAQHRPGGMVRTASPTWRCRPVVIRWAMPKSG